MPPLFDPAEDGVLISLKKIATKGGEYGPFFDRGVLAVIEQIEQTGAFTPDPVRILRLYYFSARHGEPRLMTDEERAEAEAILRDRRWSLEDGARYADGVWTAESWLSQYDRTKQGD